MSNIITAILAINPSADVTIKDEDIDQITWHSGTPISKTDILAKQTELSYINKRAAEYPNIVDQLDDIYHNGIDGWKATIKAVKDKYPKG
jgi:phosphoenolpyruvate-protein kinase (PTS system EI component)|tara:strand:+ start:573 stop:842 length:270 start_codon:yes stop_codon:yes gene_type:complete